MWWKYLSSMVCGVAIGIIIEKIIECIKENRKLKYSKILEECFGEAMYTNTFAMTDTRDWIQSKEEYLNNGCKAIVMKAIPEQLKKFGKDLDITKVVENYLIIAVVDEGDKKIKESLLVKYDKLDDILKHPRYLLTLKQTLDYRIVAEEAKIKHRRLFVWQKHKTKQGYGNKYARCPFFIDLNYGEHYKYACKSRQCICPKPHNRRQHKYN